MLVNYSNFFVTQTIISFYVSMQMKNLNDIFIWCSC